MKPLSTSLLCMALGLFASACDTPGGAAATEARADNASGALLGDVVSIVDSLTLEENDTVLNVEPTVSVDRSGNYLVADVREAQIRVYDPRGRLRSHFGRRGSGPGEFIIPQVAARLPSGDIIVADFRNRLTRFDSVGSRVIETIITPFNPIFDLDVVDDSLVLLSARSGALPGRPFLHLFDLRRKKVVRSFFVPPVPRGFESEAIVSGWVFATVQDSQIAAVVTYSDTLYLFDRNGASERKIPLPTHAFRRMKTKIPSTPGRKGLLEWGESFSSATKVAGTPDGGFLVQYTDFEGGEVRWRLLGIDRAGRHRFEVRDASQLLTMSEDGKRLVMVKPGSETPDQWVIAQLQR